MLPDWDRYRRVGARLTLFGSGTFWLCLSDHWTGTGDRHGLASFASSVQARARIEAHGRLWSMRHIGEPIADLRYPISCATHRGKVRSRAARGERTPRLALQASHAPRRSYEYRHVLGPRSSLAGSGDA